MPAVADLPDGNQVGDIPVWDGTSWVPTQPPAPPTPVPDQRIIELPPESSPRDGDEFAIDAEDRGTRRITVGDLLAALGIPPGNNPGDILVWDGSHWVPTAGTGGVTTPAAPSNLVATSGDTQITLSWQPSSGATGYNVLFSTTSGGPYTPLQSGLVGTNFTHTGLTNGTTYYYVVTASNATGTSPNSNQASATPAASIANKPVYFGRSTAPKLLTEAEVLALATHMDNDFKGTYACGSAGTPNFVFLAWPSAFGGPVSPNGIMFGAFPSSMADSSVGYGTTVVNGYSVETLTVNGEPYLIYRLYNETAGDVTLTTP